MTHEMLNSIRRGLRRAASPSKSKNLSRFFKTGPGQYGEGDQFLGVMVPAIRKFADQGIALSLSEILRLLKSPFNEERLLGALILVKKYDFGTSAEQRALFTFYLKNQRYFNNWNLVDASAPYILGRHLLPLPIKARKILVEYSSSKKLWARRTAIVSTLWFIRNDQFDDTLKICTKLLKDEEDLIHKACGWMLREVGKRDALKLRKYLNEYGPKMPRTMLRYAIEKFGTDERSRYLKMR